MVNRFRKNVSFNVLREVSLPSIHHRLMDTLSLVSCSLYFERKRIFIKIIMINRNFSGLSGRNRRVVTNALKDLFTGI
mgnify:CR=1 FL=1